MMTHEDDIELSTDAFPLLGYTVIATLKGIEFGHDELLGPLAIAHYRPALPEARTGPRRTIHAWLYSLVPGAGFETVDDDADPDMDTRWAYNAHGDRLSQSDGVSGTRTTIENPDVPAEGDLPAIVALGGGAVLVAGALLAPFVIPGCGTLSFKRQAVGLLLALSIAAGVGQLFALLGQLIGASGKSTLFWATVPYRPCGVVRPLSSVWHGLCRPCGAEITALA